VFVVASELRSISRAHTCTYTYKYPGEYALLLLLLLIFSAPDNNRVLTLIIDIWLLGLLFFFLSFLSILLR
jgi:hypothetical protein